MSLIINSNIMKISTFLIVLCCILLNGNAHAAIKYERVLYAEDFQIGTMLNWSTLSEDQNKMFVIEKSTDGLSFDQIGTVKGGGTSSDIRVYNYLDLESRGVMVYYRLRQVDFDGSNNVSDILTVQKEFTNNLLISKLNGANTLDVFEAQIESAVDGIAILTVKSILNVVVIQKPLALNQGPNLLSLSLKDLKPDIYKLEITMGDEVESLVIERNTDPSNSKPAVASSQKTKGN